MRQYCYFLFIKLGVLRPIVRIQFERSPVLVGKKLKALARRNQVLCVTHLPQIASFADHHYLIGKRESAGRTRTSIRRLSPAERAEEVARMMSGAKVTDTSLKHAEQLLKTNA